MSDSTAIFSDTFTSAIRDFAELLNNGFKKANPVSALLMDDTFQNSEENNQALVTFNDGILMIENREDSNSWVVFTGTELWQIVAFALDNGLQLPQNEDDKE